METQEKTLENLVQELGITAQVSELENSDSFPEWAKQGWLITLQYQGRRMSFNFYGGGKSATPTATDGVWVMAIESRALYSSFDDWAQEFGYDTDSRKALQTFNQIQDYAREWVEFIGDRITLDELEIAAFNY